MNLMSKRANREGISPIIHARRLYANRIAKLIIGGGGKGIGGLDSANFMLNMLPFAFNS